MLQELVTIIDVETTGLDPATDEVIEVAAILYSVEHRAVLQEVSTLLPVRGNGAEDVNGIKAEWTELDMGGGFALEMIQSMVDRSCYAVAYNSDFDSQWVSKMPIDMTIPWSDTAAIRYPRPSASRSLVSLCLAHGIPVVSAHRALDDCRLLAQLLGKVPDLEGELARAARPKVLVKALVSYDNRHLASKYGFRWDRDVPRAWAKRMPWEDVGELPFEVVEVVL